MISKLKQIDMSVGTTRKMADIVVVVSVPFKGVAPCCLNRLKTNCGEPDALMKGSEESALLFALYETVRDKLSGSGFDIMKSKSSNVKCAYINDNVVLSFHTAGTGTALRKASGLLLSVMNPVKLFSRYSENIRFLSGKGGKREEFNFVAKKLAEGIKKSISITVIGKINIDKPKMEDILKVLVKKVPEIDLKDFSDSAAPAKKTPEKEEKSYPLIKCDGIAAVVTADYIRNNSVGMSVEINNDGITVYNHLWESKHKQLKDAKRVTDYVSKKYDKLGAELPAVFAYYAASEGFSDAAIAAKIVASKLTTKDLAAMVKKTL